MIERRTAVCALEAVNIGFAHARQAVRAEREVTRKRTGGVTAGVRHYVSSIAPEQSNPSRMARLVRGHWTVENNIHWLRDAVGREDGCRLRDNNAASALALLRTALLAPVRAAGHESLTRLQESCAKDRDVAVRLITLQRLAQL